MAKVLIYGFMDSEDYPDLMDGEHSTGMSSKGFDMLMGTDPEGETIETSDLEGVDSVLVPEGRDIQQIVLAIKEAVG